MGSLGCYLKIGDLIRVTDKNALDLLSRRHGITESDIGIIIWSYDLSMCKAYFPRVDKVRPLTRRWIEIISEVSYE